MLRRKTNIVYGGRGTEPSVARVEPKGGTVPSKITGEKEVIGQMYTVEKGRTNSCPVRVRMTLEPFTTVLIPIYPSVNRPTFLDHSPSQTFRRILCLIGCKNIKCTLEEILILRTDLKIPLKITIVL